MKLDVELFEEVRFDFAKPEAVEESEDIEVPEITDTEDLEDIDDVEDLEDVEAIDELEEPVVVNTKKSTKKKKKVYTSKEKLSARKKLNNVLAFAEEEEEYEDEAVIDNEPIVESTGDFEDDNDSVLEVASFKRSLKLAKSVKKRGRKKVRHFTRKIVQTEEPFIVPEEIEIEEPVTKAKVKKAKKVEPIEESEEFDIFGEKYRDIDSTLAEIDKLDELDALDELNGDLEDLDDFDDDVKNGDLLEDELDVASATMLEDSDEESIFEVFEEEKDNIQLSEIDLSPSNAKKKSKNKLFSGLKKLNAKSKKSLANE